MEDVEITRVKLKEQRTVQQRQVLPRSRRDQEMALRFNNLEVSVNFQKNNSREMMQADKKETLNRKVWELQETGIFVSFIY